MSPDPPPGLGLLVPDIDLQAACVAACVRASTVCSVTADACLDDDGVAELRSAIRLLLDCVDVLTATATVLSRHFATMPGSVGTLLSACVDLAEACADEVGRYAPVEHRQRCVDECRRAAYACQSLLDSTVSSRSSRRRRR
jgi:hypothetical protein